MSDLVDQLTEISDTFSFKAFGCKTDSYASQTLRFLLIPDSC